MLAKLKSAMRCLRKSNRWEVCLRGNSTWIRKIFSFRKVRRASLSSQIITWCKTRAKTFSQSSKTCLIKSLETENQTLSFKSSKSQTEFNTTQASTWTIASQFTASGLWAIHNRKPDRADSLITLKTQRSRRARAQANQPASLWRDTRASPMKGLIPEYKKTYRHWSTRASCSWANSFSTATLTPRTTLHLNLIRS